MYNNYSEAVFGLIIGHWLPPANTNIYIYIYVYIYYIIHKHSDREA